MTTPIIELHSVGCVYPDGHRALRNISLSIPPGQRIGLIGANGAGKTSLLSLITGLLLPKEGAITIGGTPLTPSTLESARQKLGFVFQNPDDQLFMPTVQEDAAFGPRAAKLPEPVVAERVTTALQQTGTLHLKDRFTWKLSGGEKRSAAIASVLACAPEFLILDEPTAGLDPRSRRNLINLLSHMPQGCLIASHDMDFVLGICQRTVILKAGEIAADGATELLLRDQTLLEACGLELPLSYHLSLEVP